MIRVAVIADPHVHDTAWRPAGSGLSGAVRSYADTAASTRVFNESIPAFRTALDRAAADGARLVVVPGDLTDDGQRPNIEAALRLAAEYERRHGLRLFMTPGNHDFFARLGRRQVKEFVDAGGRRVTLDSAAPTGAGGPADTATLGAPEALVLMADLGFCPRPGDLHFETPFGTDPAFAARMHRATSADGRSAFDMIDASYLIEPVAGLWLLSIDANVVAPRDGCTDPDRQDQLLDPTDGGWPAVLRTRPHLLPWMRSVADRAAARNKALVAFSHYPALDPLGGTCAAERALFGPTGLARRDPGAEVAAAFAATGVRVHLSGHLHVNDTGLHRTASGGFVNIAVPSPVGFVPAMKILDVAPDRLRVRTIRLDEAAGHDAAFADYRREAAAAGEADVAAATAQDHVTFIDHHLRDLVVGRYMAREWPDDMRAFVRTATAADLELLLWPDATPSAGGSAIPMQTVCDDWYRLRKAADLAQGLVPADRIALYRRWIPLLPQADTRGLAARFAAFVALLARHLDRAPTIDVSIDLRSIAVVDDHGRTLRRQTV